MMTLFDSEKCCSFDDFGSVRCWCLFSADDFLLDFEKVRVFAVSLLFDGFLFGIVDVDSAFAGRL